MIDEATFIEAIKHSGLSKVAIIDDVFDAPKVNDDNSGKVLDYLEKPATATAFTEINLDQAVRDRLKTAVESSNFDSDDITKPIEQLYAHYIDTLDSRFDPAGMFNLLKGPNLSRLQPLLTLLKKCTSIKIQYAGSEHLSTFKETHLLFIDFYLDEDLGPDEKPTGKQGSAAVSASLNRVKQLINDQSGKTPSVVLMSSRDVSARADVFRENIGKGKVFASRFAFLNKGHVKTTTGGRIEIEPDAADALFDVVHSYEFGRALQAGLDCWLDSAKDAVEDLRDEIGHLELRDFAYLVRFRLAQEGQGLLDYLEWFFGECLVDSIGTRMDTSSKADAQISGLNGNAADLIKGAFDGPTKKVAELYHRVRIEAPRTSRIPNYRLGDIYHVGSKNIVATMTPDCDLIRRPGGKRRAPQLLTVGGRLKPFDAPEGSVSDFFIMNKKPYNIAWDRKDMETRDFTKWPKPGASSDDVKFLGTLRPLYAQQLQRDLLHDLGRVGLSVAPAIGITAAVTATYRKKGGQLEELDLSQAGPAPSVVVMSRGGTDKAKVIFKRGFLRSLLKSLQSIDPKVLEKPDVLKSLMKANAREQLEKKNGEGLALEATIAHGIFLTSQERDPTSSWCWLRVSMVEVEE